VVIGERVRRACRGDERGVAADRAMVVAPVAVVEGGTASVGLYRAAFHTVVRTEQRVERKSVRTLTTSLSGPFPRAGFGYEPRPRSLVCNKPVYRVPSTSSFSARLNSF
jgi:hypothetical protein